MGGESGTVLRLRLMRKLAMPLNVIFFIISNLRPNVGTIRFFSYFFQCSCLNFSSKIVEPGVFNPPARQADDKMGSGRRDCMTDLY